MDQPTIPLGFTFVLNPTEIDTYNAYHSVTALTALKYVDEIIGLMGIRDLYIEFKKELGKAFGQAAYDALIKDTGELIIIPTGYISKVDYIEKLVAAGYHAFIDIVDGDLRAIRTLNTDTSILEAHLSHEFEVWAGLCSDRKHNESYIKNFLEKIKASHDGLYDIYSREYDSLRDKFMKTFNEAYYIPSVMLWYETKDFLEYSNKNWNSEAVTERYYDYLNEFNRRWSEVKDDSNLDASEKYNALLRFSFL